MLWVVSAIVTFPAGHQRWQHDLAPNSQWVAHKVYFQGGSLFNNNTSQFMTQRKGPGEGFGPMPLEDMQIGPAHTTGTDFD